MVAVQRTFPLPALDNTATLHLQLQQLHLQDFNSPRPVEHCRDATRCHLADDAWALSMDVKRDDDFASCARIFLPHAPALCLVDECSLLRFVNAISRPFELCSRPPTL